MTPGEPTLDPLTDNLSSALKHEISLSYPQTLNNKYTLKVKIDSSNFAIRYKKKGYEVVLFIIWFGGKKEYCNLEKLSLSASYELYNGDQLVKKGAVTKNNSSDEKILGSTPLPWTDPYNADNPFDPRNDPNSPFYSPFHSIEQQGNEFAFGGAASTIGNGLLYGYVAYDNTITDVAHEIVEETKGSVQ